MAATDHGDRRSGTPGAPEPQGADEVVVLRRTRRQWLVGAAGWSLLALPLLVVVPVLEPGVRALVVVAALLAAVTIAVVDLTLRRDVRVEIGLDGLRCSVGLLPWWSITELRERRRLGSRRVEVVAFDQRLELEAPRTGPLAPNEAFDHELGVLRAALELSRRRDPVVIADRVVEEVIDLRQSVERREDRPSSTPAERPPV